MCCWILGFLGFLGLLPFSWDIVGIIPLNPWLTVSRPVGGILFPLVRGFGGHPSERSTWEWCSRRTPDGPSIPLFDLAPGGVYRADRVTPAAGALLPHRFTLTCAQPGAAPSAVCSLWHFPAGRPDWPLASTLPCGVPTFLDPARQEGSPPPGRAAATRPAHRPLHRPTPRDGPAPDRHPAVAGPIPSQGASNLAPCPSNHAPNASWSTTTGPDALSITEFYRRVDRAIRTSFPEELWITGEIRSIKVLPRGPLLHRPGRPHQRPGTAGRPRSTSSAGRPGGGASAPPSTGWASSSMPAWWCGPGARSSSTRPAAPSTSSFPSSTPTPSWARWPPSGPD